ncbi:peptidoglycan-binding protein [Streptomyces sp. NPDC087218]|uniref:peptidoglycan-binding protein n=1 Tax=Streptomyces sp. NPDC087218 TaxID=3365769 RepID=UPI003824CC56
MSASRQDGQGARPADIELFEENVHLPGTPSPSSSPSPSSLPSGPEPAVLGPARRSAGRSAKHSAGRSAGRRRQSPALLIGTVTVGISAAISVSLVCEAFTARHTDLGAPVSTTLSTRDSATPSPSSSSTAAPTGTARPAQKPAHTQVTRSTSETPPPATSSATPPAAPSTPAGPPARTPSPPRDEIRAAGRPDLALGSTGREVEDLQRRLQQLYLYLGSTDGNFTTAVEVALSRYQKARNIPEKPGVYGPLTRAALRAETESAGRDSREYENSGRYGHSPQYGNPGPHGNPGLHGNPGPQGNPGPHGADSPRGNPAPHGNPGPHGNSHPYGNSAPYGNSIPSLDYAVFQGR